MTIAALSSGNDETVPRKTGENTVKHRDGGVVTCLLANHRGGSESSVVVTTVVITGIF